MLIKYKPFFESLIELETRLARNWVGAEHRRLLTIKSLPPEPEHFDHTIDLYYEWLNRRDPQWLERGIFSALALREGTTLELGCGDGFNARNFYSLRSKRVIGCDFDPKAIATAIQKNPAPNIEYILLDIRDNLPPGSSDNIIWDNSVEHFTVDEMADILTRIKRQLSPEGIVSGSTIVEKVIDHQFLHHEHVFTGKRELAEILERHFEHVTVFETIYPARHALYFWASDGSIPFGSSG